MKRLLSILAVITFFASCTREFTPKLELDNPNWRITTTTGFVPQTVPIGGGFTGTKLQVANFTITNVSPEKLAFSTSELTVLVNGAKLDDLTNLGFSIGGPTGGYASSYYAVKQVQSFQPEREVPVAGTTSDLNVSFVWVYIQTKDTHGTIQIGLRVLDTKTGEYTTKLPVFGPVATF